MNIFDIIVVAFALLAAIMGWRSGLLRSLATILGYVVAAPLAVALTPKFQIFLNARTEFVFFAVFIATGLLFGMLMRSAISELAGEHVSDGDRLGGALLGIVRIALLAVLMVLIFEQIIPSNRQPGWLRESRLRPFLSMAGQSGLRKLPPDVIDYINRMKRARGL